ncbi:MAG: trypsin-like peptidase domain-containing protein, partial [Treponema sp.]|nr:trypsin-like peptidase domain-containing protein [Treponema sp.]
MKLYSKTQLILTAFLAAAAALAGLVLVQNFLPRASDSESGSTELSEKTAAEENAESEIPSTQEPESEESFLLTNSPVLPVLNNTSRYTQDENQNIAVYEKCNEAVVNITTQVMAYDWFYNPYMTDGGSGSGSIIDKRGYVLTNVHVIENARTISISLADGSSYEGKIVGEDKESDIAVLKFEVPD